MCVDYKGYDWERPASEEDCSVLSEKFPGVDFKSLLEKMSTDGSRPLTTDLVLIGAMLSTKADDLGMCFVPFAGLDSETSEIVKLPVMEQIVEWFENSALGTDMWNHASDWCEIHHGGRFHFAMNCGCGFVDNRSKKSGNWSLWQQRFNSSRTNIYGQTRVVQRTSNSIQNTDITEAQLQIWFQIRECLESLSVINCIDERRAA